MNPESLEIFVRDRLPALCHERAVATADFGLLPATLELMVSCVRELGAARVFEFGSGRSTRAFLAAGCHVTAVEDSAPYLEATVSALHPGERARLQTFLLPLQRVFVHGAPMRSWDLPAAATEELARADIVLIDSPACPPFREHALLLALGSRRQALIIVDDANIPTVERFCRRLADQNGLASHRSRMDHGLFFICPPKSEAVRGRRSFVETLKAWRRYVLWGRGA